MTKTIPKLSKLIKTKKFDWVNSDITDDLFPEPKEIGNDFKLYHFDKYIPSEDAVKEMKKDGFRPATAWELLSWPDWNEKDWVVALGSVCEVDGGRYVPDLDGSGAGRNLSLYWWGVGWSFRCRFLAVRNSSLSTSESGTSALGDLESLTLSVSYLESEIEKIKKIINY